MKSLCNPIFILAFVLLSLLLNSRLATSQEVEDQTEFNYSVGSGKGPYQWGELHEEWEACKHGDLQSPVDLLNKRVKVQRNLGRLKRGYKPANATLKNRGHDIMERLGEVDLRIPIQVRQFRFRARSKLLKADNFPISIGILPNKSAQIPFIQT